MDNGVRAGRVYHFGTFIVDARTGELSEGGRRQPLRDQSVQLLLALLEQPAELVTREELRSRLWADGTFVDFDRSLNKAINHLREALGDSAEHPQFVETLPRKGYRFIAPVTCSGEEIDDAATTGPPLSPRARRWLALLVVLAAGIVVGAGITGTGKWMARRGTATRGRPKSVSRVPARRRARRSC